MSYQEIWEKKAREAKEKAQKLRDYDSIVEWLAAKKMSSCAFHGDYERAIDSAQLDYDLAAGAFDIQE